MARYHLCNAAADDLRGIIEYTFEQWGEGQVHIYREHLEAKLDLIVKFPEIGRTNANLPDHIYYVVEGMHYIFYKNVDDGIEVLRFLDVRMDVMRHLREYLQ